MPVFTDYPTTKQTSLNDLIGGISNIQNFQQQQQLMPLQLEKAQLELERQRQTQNPEIERVKSLSRQQLGTEAPTIQTAEETAKQALIGTKTKQYELNTKQSDEMLSGFGALLADPRIHIAHKGEDQKNAAHDAILDMKKNLENKGIDAKTVDAYTNKLTDVALHKPDLLPQTLKNIVNMGANTQQFAQLNQAPTGVATGSYQNLVPTSQFQQDKKIQAFKQELGPSQRYVPTGRVDPENDPTAYVYSADGTLLGEQKIPSGVNPQANAPANQPPIPAGAPNGIMPQNSIPPANAVARLPAYENTTTVDAARNIQAQSNKAALGVNQTQFNNNQIIKLADQTLTGTGAQALAKLGGGYAAIPFTTNETDNLQKLGHFMALETANLATSSGLGTDAARNLAGQVSGTTEWTKDAIKSTARINRALSTSTDLFNQGLNKSIAGAKNNPLAGREFTNKWSSLADVNTIRLMDAARNKDNDEIKNIVDSLGGPNSDGYKKLLLKAGSLNNLVKGQ
jgi:hypothetical protein